MKDNYLETIEELNKDFFKNYWKMEKIILAKLEKSGSDYFIDNDCYDILGKFEATLKTYCEIKEKLNAGELLTSYLHLNDIVNVKRQFELYYKDGKSSFIYKDFHKYQDSGSKLESEHLSFMYDKGVEEFAKAVFSHSKKIELFFNKEWKGILPPIVRVMFLNSTGPCPYNPNLNETYLLVKSFELEQSIDVSGFIVHETFHFINNNKLRQKCNFDIEWEMDSFKFLDEGYAQLIESKFMGRLKDDRDDVDEYSRGVVKENFFDFKRLKNEWVDLLSNAEIIIYKIAFSFAFFLEDKYGTEKHKALFLPEKDVVDKSWLEYVENYFNTKLDDLINEWKISLRL